MPLPRLLGRFNRRVTNPILWPIVARLPRSGFGRIVHVGRRSGHVYRTPVLGFVHGDRLVIALTYGPGTQWAQNVLAAGECDFETRRARRHLVEPRLFNDPERRFVPPLVRGILGALEASDFLELRVAAEEAGAPRKPARRRPRRGADSERPGGDEAVPRPDDAAAEGGDVGPDAGDVGPDAGDVGPDAGDTAILSPEEATPRPPEDGAPAPADGRPITEDDEPEPAYGRPLRRKRKGRRGAAG